MYPSNYTSSGPYPCYPSSSNSYPFFPFLNLENASSSNNNNSNSHNTLLHDPLAHVPYIPLAHHIHNTPIIPETLTNLAVSDAAAMPKQDPIIISGGAPPHHHHHYGLSSLLTKKPPKKDRHSKIYTSQGLRDRRVRLSIEIARKFFDLQDMLGFDKASNTLEWLFNKSKKAIKELAKSKNSNNSSEGDAKSFSSSSDCEDCEVASGINNNEQGIITASDHALNLQQGLDSNAVKERNKLKRAQKEPACDRAKMKESREKARARARERTSNKMCNTTTTSNSGRVMQVQDLKKKSITTTENNPQTLQQLRSPLQLEEVGRSPNKMLHLPHHPHHHHHLVGGSEAPRDDNNFNVIEESIVIRRKLKPSMMSSSHHHHHQNFMIPKEASNNNNNNSTNDYNSFPNLSPNWDANNGASAISGRSNFCTIASMNLSTGM
ncbi:hypothetical protein RIF29_19400 [Crotalaria pallida]|uniref:Uncharacterized protein n=1 Tax=Crotalaria pallida TaxID=3830 RepID=A0AAN9EZE0_CROPI